MFLIMRWCGCCKLICLFKYRSSLKNIYKPSNINRKKKYFNIPKICASLWPNIICKYSRKIIIIQYLCSIISGDDHRCYNTGSGMAISTPAARIGDFRFSDSRWWPVVVAYGLLVRSRGSYRCAIRWSSISQAFWQTTRHGVLRCSFEYRLVCHHFSFRIDSVDRRRQTNPRHRIGSTFRHRTRIRWRNFRTENPRYFLYYTHSFLLC